MLKLITLLLAFCCLSSCSEAAIGTLGGRSSGLSRGDVICDMTTGVATGVGSGTCVATPSTCNGDRIAVTRNITITDFGTNLRVFADTFVPGDVGKSIYIPGSHPTSGSRTFTITVVGAWNGTTQDVTLGSVTRANITNTSADLIYGTDDAQSFADFMTWANLTWQASNSGLVEMYIPTGKTCQLFKDVSLTASSFDPGCATPSTYGFNCGWSSSGWAKGIRRLLMNFSGSTVMWAGNPSSFFTLGPGDAICQKGIGEANGCSARTATVSAGATSVFLSDTSLCSRFTVGNYAVMTGFAVQALYSAASSFGFPPNFAFYDWVKVTSKTNCATTGQIDIDRPLTNDYKSTWPANAPGGSGAADQGGPATLYAIPFWWDAEVEYRGGTLNDGTNQTNDAGRSLTYRDITWAGGIACTYPTMNLDWAVIGGDWSACTIEMDKIVTNSSFNAATVNRIDHQSMSPRYVTITNGSVVNLLIGTPRDIRISDSTIASTGNINIGTTSFGRSDYFSATNSTINSTTTQAGANENGSISAGVWSISGQSGGPYSATMTNGIITIPNTHGAVTWGVPGANLVFSYGGSQAVRVYQVLDVTQDATNQYVTTNCVGVNTVCGAGGDFPVASGSFKISTHSAPKFNCTGGSGSTIWMATCNGPTDAPLYSYVSYTIDVSWPIGNTAFATAWGNVSSLVFTVNTPYAGAGTLNFRPTRNDVYGVWNTTGTAGSYVPSIDLKTGGTRTINSSGSCTGCGGADSTTFTYTPQWFAGQTAPSLSAHPAWAGTLDVTMTFDQGVVNP